jgi:Na+/H+ antiporter NhaD/arsenite permease-like protein
MDAHGTVQLRSRPGLKSLEIAAIILGVIAMGFLIYDHLAHQLAETPVAHVEHGPPPRIFAVLPFAGLLLCIALFPLIPSTHHWWESNKNRLMVSLAFASTTLIYYLVAYDFAKMGEVLEHALVVEYLPFIVLLFSLFVISGGISLRGDLAAHPATNTGFLAIGGLLASFIGTTGASMLLIRPLLQTNRERKHVVHTVIFFIFIVSNIGGCLLPIGDPPLFLGYLMGVPFTWTLGLWKEWAFMCAVLLVVYYVWDMIAYRKETPRDIARDEVQIHRLTLHGKFNFLLLAGVVLCVAVVKPEQELLGLGFEAFPFLRELLMLGLVALSLKFTPQSVRRANQFNYSAILEVAALFIGIFITMQAPIEILNASGETLRPYLSSPHAFYWATGALSSFLDNAPTYVVFFETAETMTPLDAPGALILADGGTIRTTWLTAISLGAVFMGAMTYIGNGPNFMVKSIAEQSGVRMPSFFGYMIYSVAILIPIFVVMTLIFL